MPAFPPHADGAGLRAKNQETAPFWNSVTAELTPLSRSKVKVQFKTFKIFNLISINAPPTALGAARAWFDSLRPASPVRPAFVASRDTAWIAWRTPRPTAPSWRDPQLLHTPHAQASWTSPTWTRSCASAAATRATSSSSHRTSWARPSELGRRKRRRRRLQGILLCKAYSLSCNGFRRAVRQV